MGRENRETSTAGSDASSASTVYASNGSPVLGDIKRRPSTQVESGLMAPGGVNARKPHVGGASVKAQAPVVEKDGSIPSSAQAQQVQQVRPKGTAWRQTLPALLLQVSLFQTTAGPIGFLALRHISFPTMVLGKVSLSGRSGEPAKKKTLNNRSRVNSSP